MSVDPKDLGDAIVDGLFYEVDRQEPELAARLEAAIREQRYQLNREGGRCIFTFPDEDRAITVEVGFVRDPARLN